MRPVAGERVLSMSPLRLNIISRVGTCTMAHSFAHVKAGENNRAIKKTFRDDIRGTHMQ